MITIPQEIRDLLDLQEGDHLVMSVEDGRIIMTPASVIPDDQAWFWTPEWQEGEREADEALAAGERGEVSYDTDSFLTALAEDTDIDVEEVKRHADT